MMHYKTLKLIIEENPDSIEFGDFGMGVSEEWIEKAEKRLGNHFPPSYKWWLKNYGGGEINGEEIFSIYEEEFNTVIGGDVVYINENSRNENLTTSNQLIIQNNDQAESYYFDLSKTSEEGESPVFVEPGSRKYADDFFDFILKKTHE